LTRGSADIALNFGKRSGLSVRNGGAARLVRVVSSPLAVGMLHYAETLGSPVRDKLFDVAEDIHDRPHFRGWFPSQDFRRKLARFGENGITGRLNLLSGFCGTAHSFSL
jgi:hypothetical protein